MLPTTGCLRYRLRPFSRIARHPPEVWKALLREPDDERIVEGLRQATRAGRPVASDSFIAKLETRLRRRLRPLPRGRPRKET